MQGVTSKSTHGALNWGCSALGSCGSYFISEKREGKLTLLKPWFSEWSLKVLILAPGHRDPPTVLPLLLNPFCGLLTSLPVGV